MVSEPYGPFAFTVPRRLSSAGSQGRLAFGFQGVGFGG